MKICQYCGTKQNENNAVCEACGANAFSHVCRNCGAVFETGVECPTCGVRVDTLAKRCPQCGRIYYTVCCPDCGYTRQIQNAAPVSANPQTARPKRLWLWALGWVLFFPIPLTVLIVRTTKLPTWAKAVLLTLLWAFVLWAGVRGEDPADSQGTDTPSLTETKFRRPDGATDAELFMRDGQWLYVPGEF